MSIQEISRSISYCGLICHLCHLANECGGCKSENNQCARHLSETGCYQCNCCRERNLNGCWECSDFDCGKDMFAPPHDLRIKAFVRFMRDESPDKLAECIAENEKNGIRYGLGKDYDGLETEDDVIRLLRAGRRDRES